MRRLILFLIVVVVIPLGLILYETISLAIYGKGLYYKTNMPAPCSQALETLEKFSKYLTFYADKYNNSLPNPKEIARQVPDIKFSSIQPYEKQNLYILENITQKERYLYWPDKERMIEDKEKTYYVIVACNLALRQDKKGLYYPYSRGSQNEPYIVIYTGLEPCYSSSFLKTDGIPPIPGCLMEINKNYQAEFWVPKQRVNVLKALYPGLNIPPKKIVNVKIP